MSRTINFTGASIDLIMKKLIFIASVLLLSACQTQPGKKEELKAENPFYQKWETPFGVPPFDQIKNEHFMPAFQKGMEENLAEKDSIDNKSDVPTFANTL